MKVVGNMTAGNHLAAIFFSHNVDSHFCEIEKKKNKKKKEGNNDKIKIEPKTQRTAASFVIPLRLPSYVHIDIIHSKCT